MEFEYYIMPCQACYKSFCMLTKEGICQGCSLLGRQKREEVTPDVILQLLTKLSQEVRELKEMVEQLKNPVKF